MKFFLQFIKILVQLGGVHAMHWGGSPMQVPPAQLTALEESMSSVGVRALQPKPMEFQQFAMHEPYFSIKHLTAELFGLTADEVHHGEQIVEQVSIPKDIIRIVKDRLGDQSSAFMKSLQESMYDPSASNTGVTSFFQFGRLTKLVKQDHKKFTEELKKIGKFVMFILCMTAVLQALVTALVQQFQYVTAPGVPSCSEVLMVVPQCVIAVLLVKFIWIFIEVNGVLKFSLQELQRVRMSLTTGDPGAW